MRRLAPIVVLAAVAACNAKVAPPAPTHVQASSTVRPHAASPTPAGPGASPAVPLPVTMLTGKVKIEADYVVSNKAGSVVSNNAGGFLTLGTGLTSSARPFTDGKGNSIISDNGGGFISDNGSGLVSRTRFISDNGSGLVSRTRFISDNGSGLVSRTRYKLAEATAPAAGELLPVRGMAVRVYEVATGRELDLRYPDGSPVFPLPTDETGSFTVPVPVALTTNIVIAADVPSASDYRLQYSTMTRAGASPVIDEDTTLVTGFMRAGFARRLQSVISTTTDAELVKLVGDKWGNAGSVLVPFRQLREAAQAAGIRTSSPDVAARMSLAVADALFATQDLDKVMSIPGLAPKWKGGFSEPALAGMADVLREIRVAAGQKLATDPAFFDKADYIVAANAKPENPAAAPYHIARASDLGDFIVQEYLLSDTTEGFAHLREIFTSLGIPPEESDRVRACTATLALQSLQVFDENRAGALDLAVARIKALANP